MHLLSQYCEARFVQDLEVCCMPLRPQQWQFLGLRKRSVWPDHLSSRAGW